MICVKPCVVHSVCNDVFELEKPADLPPHRRDQPVSAEKRFGKRCKRLAKKNSVPFARLHRLDRELHFQSRRASHLLSGGIHLAVDSCCGRISDGTVPQALKLTLPNQQTCQKNCSHNDQRLVYVVTRGRWSCFGW